MAATYSGESVYLWRMPNTPSGLKMTCDAASTFFYNAGGPVPSAFARRDTMAAEQQVLASIAANPDCPPGYTSCQVSPNPEDGYECLDINSELESCGGCRYGVYGAGNATASGIDCSALPNVRRGAVTCNRGHCEASLCVGGAKLINRQCVSVRA